MAALLPLSLFAPPPHAPWPPHQLARSPTPAARLPPIPSRYFSPLSSPSHFHSIISAANPLQVSVVKFHAPHCRTCRAIAPKLDAIAASFPSAAYFSLECARDGKAEGERMHRFFVSRNATTLPYVEVYRGDQLVEAHAIPLSRLELMRSMLGNALEAAERELSARWRRERAKLLALLQARKAERGIDVPPPPTVRPATRAAYRRKGERLAVEQLSRPTEPPRRGAPLRGATGPRGKRGLS
ncbi:hypothetical protein AB1Y20_004935 [Prymnesium parvum]|uniref:Thioredoxin domain-containing protein n=1 Tax=Prymnesium parvum TaxID=97485 RepID=A0AB34J4S5_PRYPA